ncbi:LTA synthase family protein [Paenibacillus mesophilus]|nr:LTA synthase family protein [Paenibacillus mesophilus]
MNRLYFFRKRISYRLTNNRTRKYAIVSILLAVFPLLLAFGVETIERGTFADAMSWIASNPSLFAINALIYCFVLLLIYGLIGSLFPSVALTALILFLAAMISYFKSKMIGEPFFPWDLLLKKEGTNIIPLVSSNAVLMRVSVAGAVVIALFMLRLLLPRFRLPVAGRIALVLLASASLQGMAERTPMAQKLYDRAGVSEIVWNQRDNYGANGFGLAFTLNVQNSIVSKPAGYGESSIATVAQQISDRRSASAASPTDSQPNVIFIMNEAFWDPTLLPDVTFSEDPIPTVRRLQSESTSGYLLSPQFGGGTSNVEFEVLTGNSMSFLPSGSIPYQQYIRQPVPSLASYFENNGYKSMGIHSYDGWFWNRDNVYKWLGFESFKSKEKFDNPEYKGTFISDDEVSRGIISAVEESDRPMFIYAVTMQNHGSYDDGRYEQNPIEVQGNLTADAKQLLETYTHGVRDADQSLQMLIDHFEQSGEPTVIVFYGDHLPMLGLDYDVYKQGGFIGSSSWSLEEQKKMRSVPFVLWSNFELPQDYVPTISNSFLGAYVLDKLGMELPANFAFNLNMFRQYPGLLSNLVVDADQNLHQKAPAEATPLIDQYRELQYDILFGGRYLANYLDSDYLTKSALPDYNMEFQVPASVAAPAEAEDSL